MLLFLEKGAVTSLVSLKIFLVNKKETVISPKKSFFSVSGFSKLHASQSYFGVPTLNLSCQEMFQSGGAAKKCKTFNCDGPKLNTAILA